MALRILKVIANDAQKEIFDDISDDDGVIEHWSNSRAQKSNREFNFLVSSKHLQALTDKIQRRMNKYEGWRIIITKVETAIPRYDGEEDNNKDNKDTKKIYGSLTREALYDQLLKGAEANNDFYILVFLSTLVTAIGLITNNLAVIIGAMVIAPFLGPNLALSFGVTLGDKPMIQQAFRANAIGFGLTLIISIITGFFVPNESFIDSNEFLQRTDVGFGGIILALASGAAAVLSLTSGVSSTMVGVMVAVALMPPAVTMGLSIGSGMMDEFYGAALLLAINIICVNLSAKVVFTLKGIRPRTWYQHKKSKQSLKLSLIFWSAWLLILMVIIYLRHG